MDPLAVRSLNVENPTVKGQDFQFKQQYEV